MKQAHDYRKYNVRLTSADWQRGSGRVIKFDRKLSKHVIAYRIAEGWVYVSGPFAPQIWVVRRILVMPPVRKSLSKSVTVTNYPANTQCYQDRYNIVTKHP